MRIIVPEILSKVYESAQLATVGQSGTKWDKTGTQWDKLAPLHITYNIHH
jgi:hypothetical protein